MDKTTLKNRTRSLMGDATGREIRRTWGDVEVVDAKTDLRVFIQPEDLQSAMPKDPAYCVFARACRRAFNATKVLFFRSVAYVELPDRKGVKRVERFIMGDGMRELIESFDRGQGVIPQGGFILRAPRPSDTLDAEMVARKARRERQPDRRVLDGQSHPAKDTAGIGQGRGRNRDKPLLVDLSVRSGTGAVKFARPSGSLPDCC